LRFDSWLCRGSQLHFLGRQPLYQMHRWILASERGPRYQRSLPTYALLTSFFFFVRNNRSLSGKYFMGSFFIFCSMQGSTGLQNDPEMLKRQRFYLRRMRRDVLQDI
jgi:hypothetical protein